MYLIIWKFSEIVSIYIVNGSYNPYSSIKDPGRKQVKEVESGPEEG